jgi:hypothetical protein
MPRYIPEEYSAWDEARMHDDREIAKILMREDDEFADKLAMEGIGCDYCQEKIKEFLHE